MPESPKPITRARKNKPAPIPPSFTVGTESGSVSSYTIISTTASSPSAKDKITEKSIPSNTKKQSSNEICSTTEGSNINRKESFYNSDQHNRAESSIEDSNEFISFSFLMFSKNIANLVIHSCVFRQTGKDHNHKITKIKVADENTQSLTDVTKLLPPETLNKIIESKKLAKPVPAPRISLEVQPKGTASEEVTPRKPVIPEKPTTLPRPFSCTFKSLKISDSPDIKSDVGYIIYLFSHLVFQQ